MLLSDVADGKDKGEGMRKVLTDSDKTFSIYNKEDNVYPVVISIPHSGTGITPDMDKKLVDDIILPNMDWYLPELYSFLPDMGFTVIINHVSRYVIDPNRNLSGNYEGSYKITPVYQQTTMGQDMYREKLSNKEIQNRINAYYNPYHQMIQNAISQKSRYFSKVLLLDLHSFGLNLDSDIVLGNKVGRSSSGNIFHAVKKMLEKEKFTVNDNAPFPGGFIIGHYGGLQNICEALQIELSYKSYIDNREFVNEEFPEINDSLFKEAQNKMKRFFHALQNSF